MRTSFHDQLDCLTEHLAKMCGLAADAMEKANRALLDHNLPLAEEVIRSDASLDAMRQHAEEQTHTLLVLQAPVAGDLRTIVTFVQVAERIERMGDLARHVAEQIRRRYPQNAVPADTEDRFGEMGRLGVITAREVRRLILTGETRYVELNTADDLIDRVERDLLDLVSSAAWRHGARAGVDVALLARFHERFADQAVSIARRLDYVATGSLPPSP